MKSAQLISFLVLGLFVYTLITAWIPSPISVAMTEICNNAIDDDLDGLVDLNDPDCDCVGIVDTVVQVIPNPSFEDYDDCPDDESQLEELRFWQDGNEATVDFHHLCGFTGNLDIGFAPEPFPDGSGAIGFIDGFDFRGITRKEFVGTCLNSSLSRDSTFVIAFDLGFGDGRGIWKSLSPATVAIYGTNDCAELPVLGWPCLDGVDNWQILDSVTLSGANEWVQDSFVFTPSIDINAIAIGPPCAKTVLQRYYWLDNLVLEKANAVQDVCPALWTESVDCEEVTLTATQVPDSCNYQWYLEGVALIGEVDSVLNLDSNQPGNYLLVIHTNGDCNVSDTFFYNPSIYATPNGEIDTTICAGDILRVGFDQYTTTGIYQSTVQTVDGCDSLIDIDLEVLDTIYQNIVRDICIGDQYELNGINYSTSGNYFARMTGSNGCDSTVQLQLNVIDTTRKNIFAQICTGQDYTLEGQIFNTTGNYRIHLNTQAGCDSLILLNLQVMDTLRESVTAQICSGQSYSVGSEDFNTAGNYRISLINNAGCDSLVLLDLQVIDTLKETLIAEICEGADYTAGGQLFNQSGNYEIALQAAGGCDSLVLLDLTVLDSTLENRVIKICEGESYEVRGEIFNETGVYPVTMQGQNGCDSTVVLDLGVSDGVQGEINIIDSISCYDMEDARVEFVLFGRDPVAILWNTGDTTGIIQDLVPGTYEVQITDDANCTNIFSVEIPEPRPLQLSFQKSDLDCTLEESGGSVQNIIAAGGTAPYRYFLDDIALVDINQGVTGLDTGRYALSVLDNHDCYHESTIFINDQRPDDGSVEIQVSNENPVNGEEIDLKLLLENITEPYTILWTGNNVACDSCIETSAVVREGENTYTAMVTDAFGCEYIVTIQIDVNPSIFIPNAFTPNDDGQNDYFTLYSDASIQTIEYIRIFNRLGDMIFQTTDIPPNVENLGWDGKFQGLIQNPGVYVYVIQYADGQGVSRVVSGDITLLR